MLLVVDIGNTCITLGLFENNQLKEISQFQHNYDVNKDKFLNAVNALINSFSLQNCIISSVADELTDKIRNFINNEYKIESVILSSDFVKDIDLKVEKPETLGADRLANIYAASKLYSARPLIVVDSGTATTFDVLDKNGSFIGGVIIPGFEMQFKSLHEHTSKLPLINMENIKDTSKIICDDTESEMVAGIIRGHVCAIEGLLKQSEKELSAKPFVVLTGGGANIIQKHMPKNSFNTINPNLTLQGISLAYEHITKTI